VSEPERGVDPAPFSGRAAFAISQGYYYLAAVIGVGFLLGGVIAALIGLRELVLPTPSGNGSLVESSSREAVRSILGALAFAIPGGLVFWWHLREARRRDARPVGGTFWGSALYFHLVALVALSIALGGAISLLHSLLDGALPSCYSHPTTGSPDPSFEPEVGSPIATLSPVPELIGTERECYPPTSQALRSAADALIVTVVAGGTWAWHLGRGRREPSPPPSEV
jgi:Domain of unknown function (DUF5671)